MDDVERLREKLNRVADEGPEVHDSLRGVINEYAERIGVLMSATVPKDIEADPQKGVSLAAALVSEAMVFMLKVDKYEQAYMLIFEKVREQLGKQEFERLLLTSMAAIVDQVDRRNQSRFN